MTSKDNSLHRRLRAFALASGGLSVLIAGAVLFGWGLDIPWLVSLSPHYVSMKPLTAICFVLCGLSLSILAPGMPREGLRRLVAGGFAFVAALAGVATEIEFAAGRNLEFDEYFVRGALQATRVVHPGRMSLATGIAFGLLGIALICAGLKSSKAAWPAQFIALLVVFLSVLHFLGYLYGVEDLYRTFHHNSMATHTAFLFF